jgi:hypothetical protein
MSRIPDHIRASSRTKALAVASIAALLGLSVALRDEVQVKGVYTLQHYRGGELIYQERFENTVVTVGKNLILDQSLAGAAYTATEYLGLISSASYSSISAADTMTSHAGWLESGGANAPTMSSSRGTCAWSSASSGSKSLSASLSFSITGTGTIKGAFMVGGSGASATVGNTGGTLISAGLFTGGDRAVISGDTVQVSYTMSI